MEKFSLPSLLKFLIYLFDYLFVIINKLKANVLKFDAINARFIELLIGFR